MTIASGVKRASRSTRAAAESDPEGSVKRAILNGFAYVLGCDRVATGEISDRARDFENPIVGARAQVQLRHRDADQLLRFVSEQAVLLDLPRTHAGVAVCLRVG